MKGQAYFYKVFKGLVLGFDMCEAAFMAYMANLAERRNRGYVTVCSLKVHLAATGMGRRTFERYAGRSIRMGLLEKVPVDGKYDYIWDMTAYLRLVEILSATSNPARLRTFCKEVFETQGRKVMSITDDEKLRLEEG